MAKARILVSVGHYRLAFRAGGPVKSLENIAVRLAGEFAFSFVTSDRDIGDSEAFREVPLGLWVERPEGRVYYARREHDGFCLRRRLLRKVPYDLLYLSGFFAKETVYAPIARRLGMVPLGPVIVAPRGDLMAGALQLKPTKKKIYMRLGRLFGLFDGVLWHATSEEELEAILHHMGHPDKGGDRVQVCLAENIPTAMIEEGDTSPSREKSPGTARAIFLGRVSPKKNLRGAIEMVCAARAGGIDDRRRSGGDRPQVGLRDGREAAA
jgi:hypothetical protein